MAMNGHAPAKLSADDLDDLIYACRTNALDELKEFVASLASRLNVSEANILASAIDVDEDGLGARTCLLHYPAANGNLEMVNYLLETLRGPISTSDPVNGTSFPDKAVIPLTNHQNVSGNTPLHWAALNGHLEVVQALFNAGADPTVVNEAGRDAVVEAEYSAKDGATECATWLLKECEALEAGAAGVDSMQGMDTDDIAEGNNDEDRGEMRQEDTSTTTNGHT